MEYPNISKIVEVTRWEDVNKYLELGWGIINIYNTAHPVPGPVGSEQQPHYVLGWGQLFKEPKYPDLSRNYDYSDKSDSL